MREGSGAESGVSAMSALGESASLLGVEARLPVVVGCQPEE